VKVVVATRSADKLREIRQVLRGVRGIELVDLNDAAVAESPEEDSIERFASFEENARGKADYFAALTGLPTIADDSGIAVDALGGAPGVRSKRYAPATDGLSGEERDRANLLHLLTALDGRPLGERGARYVCVAALDLGDGRGPTLFRGEVEGLLLDRPRGFGGFGYDPIFFHPPSGRTFAELLPPEKDAVSHRGAAFRALGEALERCARATRR
jgi:XTP/dITP diphosphohydrolase